MYICIYTLQDEDPRRAPFVRRQSSTALCKRWIKGRGEDDLPFVHVLQGKAGLHEPLQDLLLSFGEGGDGRDRTCVAYD